MGPQSPKAAHKTRVSSGGLKASVIARLSYIIQGQLEDAIKHHVEIVGYTKSVSGKALEKALRKILVYFSSANAAPDELKCLLETFAESLEPLRVPYLLGFHTACLFASSKDSVL